MHKEQNSIYRRKKYLQGCLSSNSDSALHRDGSMIIDASFHQASKTYSPNNLLLLSLCKTKRTSCSLATEACSGFCCAIGSNRYHSIYNNSLNPFRNNPYACGCGFFCHGLVSGICKQNQNEFLWVLMSIHQLLNINIHVCTSETCYPMLFYCLMADVSDSISTTALSVTAEPRRKGPTLPLTWRWAGSRRDDAIYSGQVHDH